MQSLNQFCRKHRQCGIYDNSLTYKYQNTGPNFQYTQYFCASSPYTCFDPTVISSWLLIFFHKCTLQLPSNLFKTSSLRDTLKYISQDLQSILKNTLGGKMALLEQFSLVVLVTCRRHILLKCCTDYNLQKPIFTIHTTSSI